MQYALSEPQGAHCLNTKCLGDSLFSDCFEKPSDSSDLFPGNGKSDSDIDNGNDNGVDGAPEASSSSSSFFGLFRKDGGDAPLPSSGTHLGAIWIMHCISIIIVLFL